MGKTEIPLLSIVILTRNRRAMVEQAIRSSLLPLPFPYECIVSDNASEDSTPELAELFPQIKYIRRPQLIPMWDHWNLCAREGTGKYVKMLCDDDWLIPGALEREVSALQNDPSLTAVASARNEVRGTDDSLIRVVRYSSSVARLEGFHLQFAMLLHENILGPPSDVTFRRDCFLGFPEGYSYVRDWAAWIQLADQGPIAFLPEPGCNYRIHPQTLTSGYVAAGTDFIEVQALRRDCLRRLPAGLRLAGEACFAWIWFYRLARRMAKFTVRAQFQEMAKFLRKVAAYRAPVLPLGSKS